MAIIGNISGSQTTNWVVGVSGSVIIANPGYEGWPEEDYPVIGEANSGIGTNVTLFVSGSKKGDTHAGATSGATSLFGGDVHMSGALVIGGGDVGGEYFILGGLPEVMGADEYFIVSGNIGSRGTAPNQGGSGGMTATFKGDTVVSGVLLAGGSDFHYGVDGPGAPKTGGTISGSIHMTSGGLSYLVAGSGIGIASSSNGQVTFTASGGGGGTPAGSDTYVQFNDGGSSFGASAKFTWDDTNLNLGRVGGGQSTGIYFRDESTHINSWAEHTLTLSASNHPTGQWGLEVSAEGDSASRGANGIRILSGSSVQFRISGTVDPSSGMPITTLSGSGHSTTINQFESEVARFQYLTNNVGMVLPGSNQLLFGTYGAYTGKIHYPGAGNKLLISGTSGLGIGCGTDSVATVEVSGSTVQLNANIGDAGLLDFNAGTGGLDLDTSGPVALTSTYNNASAVTIQTNGGSSEKLTLTNIQGTNAAAVGLYSTAGGVHAQFAASNTLKLTNANDDLKIYMVDDASTAANEKITVTNTAGTAADAIGLATSAGGITISAGLDILLKADGGDIIFDDGSGALLTVDVDNDVMYPADDADFDLGKSDKRFKNVYTSDLHLSNERGNWTLVEETDMLTFRNNKTGKWYRMSMEEIDPTGRDDGMKGAPPMAGVDDDVMWEI